MRQSEYKKVADILRKNARPTLDLCKICAKNCGHNGDTEYEECTDGVARGLKRLMDSN